MGGAEQRNIQAPVHSKRAVKNWLTVVRHRVLRQAPRSRPPHRRQQRTDAAGRRRRGGVREQCVADVVRGERA